MNQIKAEFDSKSVERIKKWVRATYSPMRCGWTAMRSYGNYDDCFSDGSECGESWAAYTVGQMLDMDLEDPEESDEDE